MIRPARTYAIPELDIDGMTYAELKMAAMLLAGVENEVRGLQMDVHSKIIQHEHTAFFKQAYLDEFGVDTSVDALAKRGIKPRKRSAADILRDCEEDDAPGLGDFK